MRRVVIALGLLLLSVAPASAQVPSRVRLFRPSCEGAVAWGQLEEALRVELRTMGSDLAGDGSAAPEESVGHARLVIDGCGDAEITAELSNPANGRRAVETLSLGDPGTPAPARVLAVALSELIRVRWPELLAAAPIDQAALREAVRGELRDGLREELREELGESLRGELAPVARSEARAALAESTADAAAAEPAPPGAFVDVALAVAAYPASSNALGELRSGLSIPVGPLRLGLELAASAGWAPASLGDVVLGGLGGAVALRLAHAEAGLVVEAGPRVDASWIHAQGVSDRAGVGTGAADRAHVAAGLDVRVRVHLFDGVWLMLGGDVGAALVGLDAREDDRRITAQQGPRLALSVGLAFVVF